MNHRSRDDGESGVVLGVALEFAWCLKNGIESPAGDAVDEEADEKTLINEGGTGLHARAWEKKKCENIVVDSKAETWKEEGEDDCADEETVKGEVAEETAFTAEVEDL